MDFVMDQGAPSSNCFDMSGYPPARSTIRELLQFDAEARGVIKAWEDEILSDPGFRALTSVELSSSKRSLPLRA